MNIESLTCAMQIKKESEIQMKSALKLHFKDIIILNYIYKTVSSSKNNKIKMKDIIEHCKFAQAEVVTIIRKLQKEHQLLTKKRNTNDERTVSVSLTTKGQKEIPYILENANRIIEDETQKAQ